MAGLTRITIDFQTSHLIFPILIGTILLLLGGAILLRDRTAIATSGAMWARTWRGMDRPRLLGALALTVFYFLTMVPVGDVWPNSGYGFLLCSVPYMALLGVLFMHERSPRKIAVVLAISVVAPLGVWWLFSEIFFLTLP